MTDSRLIKGFLQHIILIRPELRCYVSCHISDLSGLHVLNLLCYLKQQNFNASKNMCALAVLHNCQAQARLRHSGSLRLTQALTQ